MALQIDTAVTLLRTHAETFRMLGVVRMDVFGSVARGEATEGSDVDLIVDLDPDARVSLFDLMDMEERSAAILGVPVDLMTRKSLKPRIAKAVAREAVNVF